MQNRHEGWVARLAQSGDARHVCSGNAAGVWASIDKAATQQSGANKEILRRSLVPAMLVQPSSPF